jgi:hypothetical protein
MKKATANASLSTKTEARRFSKAAKAFSKRATQSKKAARETLIALGTHTAKGNLTTRYK